MLKLYIFNPEHDMAMANGSAGFQAPESAVLLAENLSTLPCWYADGDAIVLSADKLDAPFSSPLIKQDTVAPYSEEIAGEWMPEPWGWDAAVAKTFHANGIDGKLIPSVAKLNMVRELSHRRISSAAMEYLRERTGDANIFPQPAVELKTISEINDFMDRNGRVVLKAPWSGSGRGVLWAERMLTPSIAGWCKRVLERQGSVMGEVAMERVQDFAMEFKVTSQGVIFAGYSLFSTETTGVYRGNRLLSNEDIERELTYYIDKELLDKTKEHLIAFLTERLKGSYVGYVGVDMFIFRADNSFKLNPIVELNLRMTMGMVARIFYDRFVDKGSHGWFSIDHNPPGVLLADHKQQTLDYPLSVSDNRILEGYMSLCPVTSESVYRASVILQKK